MTRASSRAPEHLLRSLHALTHREAVTDSIVQSLDARIVGATLLACAFSVASAEAGYDSEKMEYESTAVTTTMRFLVTVVSLISAFWVQRVYAAEEVASRARGDMRETTSWRPGRVWRCAIEMLIHLLHVPPWIVPSTFEAAGWIVFLRLYRAPRVARNMSRVYADRGAIRVTLKERYSSKSAASLPPKFNANFSVKVLFDANPLGTILALVAAFILVSAFMLHIFERQSNPGLGRFFDAVYLAVITMVAVGYGDFTPVTSLGRIVAMATGFMGVILAALVVHAITRNLSLKPHQRAAADIADEVRIAAKLKVCAARLIQTAWRRSRLLSAARAASSLILDRGAYERAVGARQLRLDVLNSEPDGRGGAHEPAPAQSSLPPSSPPPPPRGSAQDAVSALRDDATLNGDGEGGGGADGGGGGGGDLGGDGGTDHLGGDASAVETASPPARSPSSLLAPPLSSAGDSSPAGLSQVGPDSDDAAVRRRANRGPAKTRSRSRGSFRWIRSLAPAPRDIDKCTLHLHALTSRHRHLRKRLRLVRIKSGAAAAQSIEDLRGEVRDLHELVQHRDDEIVELKRGQARILELLESKLLK